MKNLLAGCLLIQVLAVILLSCVPPVSRDALTHHLALPKLYLENGGIFEIPSLVFSYYPMNLDLLYTIPLALGNDIAPKFIHFAFAIFTAVLIFRYLKKRNDTNYALFGALFFLSMPIIVKLSITVYVDLGFVFFSTAAILSLFTWMEKSFDLKYLVIPGIWCGLAMGTKYNGMVLFFLLVMLIPFVHSRCRKKSRRSAWGAPAAGAVFAASALLVFSPWMVKNYIWTQNPIFPLYDVIFNPGRAIDTGFPGLFAVRAGIYGESWWQIALVPLRIFYEGQDNVPRYFDGKLNIFLAVLPLFAFVGGRAHAGAENREKIVLAGFSILFLLFVFFLTGMRIRYVAPIIPPLVILSVFGVREIIGFSVQRWGRRLPGCLVCFLIILIVAPNIRYLIEQFRYVKPLDYICKRVGRDAYIEKYVPEYPVVKFVNTRLGTNVGILCLFLGNRGYYFDRNACFDDSYFLEIAAHAEKPLDIALAVRARGLTHILVRYDLMNKWAKDNLGERQRNILGSFFKSYVSQLYFQRGYGVFELL